MVFSLKDYQMDWCGCFCVAHTSHINWHIIFPKRSQNVGRYTIDEYGNDMEYSSLQSLKQHKFEECAEVTQSSVQF